MIRWQTFALCLAAVALVACGGTAVAPPRSIAESPTDTTRAAAATTGTGVPARTVQAITPTTTVPTRAPGTTTGAVPSRAAPITATVAARPSTIPITATAAPRSSAPSPAPTSGGGGVTPPAGPTAVPQPNGTIPAGWLVYRGPAYFPFAIAYPPDWTLDDSLLPEQRVIFLEGPDAGTYNEEIYIELGDTATGANIDVQRDDFFYERTDFCIARGIEYTNRRTISGETFAVLGGTCEAGNALSFMLAALGLKGGDEWRILMRTPYDRKDQHVREIFDPMLASLNIYALAPREP